MTSLPRTVRAGMVSAPAGTWQAGTTAASAAAPTQTVNRGLALC